jgi:hypothetical protein
MAFENAFCAEHVTQVFAFGLIESHTHAEQAEMWRL